MTQRFRSRRSISKEVGKVMADSNELPKGTENPLAVTTLVIKNRLGGGTHIQQKDAKGKWLKKVKPLIPTVEFTRKERKALSKVRADGMTEYMKAFMNLLRIAQYEGDGGEDESKFAWQQYRHSKN